MKLSNLGGFLGIQKIFVPLSTNSQLHVLMAVKIPHLPNQLINEQPAFGCMRFIDHSQASSASHFALLYLVIISPFLNGLSLRPVSH